MKIFFHKTIFIGLLATAIRGTSPAQTLTISGTETYNAPVSTLPVGPNNPTMWLDAADLSNFTLTGNHVGTWADETGNGRSVSRTDARTNQPTIGINPVTGLASVVFDGRDVLSNTYNVGTPYTIFTVSSMAGSQNLRLLTTTNNNWLLGYWGGGENRMYAEGWVLGAGGPGATTNQHFYGATGTGANTTVYDGNSILASNTGGLQAPNGISLGAWNNNPGNEASRGYVSELLIFNRVLSAGEITSLNTYLQTKWTPGGQIADNTEVIVNTGNTLALNNTAETIGTLTGDGSVTLTNAVLGTGANNASTAFSGTISGTGGITKLGTGTQALSGANSYTGGTQVHQGTLNLGSSGNVGSADSIVNVGSHLGQGTLTIGGGSLQASSISVGGDGAGVVNVNGGTMTANVDTGFGSLVAGLYNSGTINQTAGTVTVQGGGYGILGRYGNATGTYNLSGGTLQTNGSSLFLGWDSGTATGNLNVSGTGQAILNTTILEIGLNGTANVNVSDSGLINVQNQYIIIDRNASGASTVNVSGNGILRTTGGSNDRSIYMAWDQTGSTGNLNISGNGQVSTVQNLNAGGNGNATITLSGTGSLSVAGLTTLALNATSNATLNVNGGTFTTGSLRQGLGTATINMNGGTLRATGDFFNEVQTNILAGGGTVDTNGRNLSFSTALAGSGTLTKTGAGSLTLRQGSAFTGGTVITGGTLALAATNQPDLLYTFDSQSSGIVTNQGALLLDGTLRNGAAITSGANGRNGSEALTIADDSTQWMQVGATGADHDSVYTIAGWFQNLWGTDNWRTFTRGNATDHHIIVESGSNRLGTFVGGYRDSGSTLLPGQPAGPNWAHVAIVANGSTSTFYVNGVNVGSNAFTSTADVFAIGNFQNSNQPFAEKIDDFTMFTRALSGAEIGQLYNGSYAVNHNTNILADNQTVAIGGAGSLDLRGNTETIGSLTNSGGTGGTVTNSLAAVPATLTVGADNTNATFSGRLTGNLSLTKTGTGNQTISGMSNYSGATNVSAGTLTLGPVNRVGDAAVFYNFDSLTNLGSAGAAYNGILQGGATTGAGGLSGNALSIADNSNQYLQVGAGGIPLGASYTLNAWFQNLYGTDNWRTLARASGSGGHHVIVENGTNNLGLFNGGFVDSGSDLFPGNGSTNWSQISAVVSGGTTTFYLNGAVVGTAASAVTPDIFALGNYQGGSQPFAQRLDDIGIYTRALSADEISSLHRGDRLPYNTDLAIASGATVDLNGGHQQVASLANLGGGGGTVTNTGAAPATLAVVGPADTTFSGSLQNGANALGLSKAGTGTLTLAGNNTHTGTNTVAGGTLIAASNTALGSGAGPTNVGNGATLGLQGNVTITGETIALNGTGAAGRNGALENLSGNNTLGATGKIITNPGTTNFTVANTAGSLTIDSPVEMRGANATFNGAGNTIVNGVISGSPLANLTASQNVTVTAGAQTFSARVDNDGSNNWLLIGRGRQGWEFDTDGQGTAASVNSNLGTTAGFAPAAYSDAIVNELLSQMGATLAGAEVRIRRATDIGGTAWQEARWFNFGNSQWTFDLDQASGLPVSYNILSGTGAPYTLAASNTRDAGNNDFSRIFTWAWGGHNNQQGFSFGNSVGGVDNNSPTSFMWEYGTENHAIPYTEIYIRPLVAATNVLVKNGPGDLTLTAANTYKGATIINDGTLFLTSTGSLAGDVIVNNGGTFTNNGTVAGDITVNPGGIRDGSGQVGNMIVAGVHRPGNSPGVDIITGNYTLASGGLLEIELPTQLGIVPSAAGLTNAEIQSYITGVNNNAYNNALPLQGGLNDPGLADLTVGVLHDALEVGGAVIINPASNPLDLGTYGTIEVISLPAAIQKGMFFDIFDINGDKSELILALGIDEINGGGDIYLAGGGLLQLPDLRDGSGWSYFNYDLSLLATQGIIILVPEPGRFSLVLLAMTGLALRRRRSPR